jgi:pyruvate kinase
LRVGTFSDGPIELRSGDRFRLDLDNTTGDPKRVPLPHPEVFAALTPGIDLLLGVGVMKEPDNRVTVAIDGIGELTNEFRQ